MKKIKKDPNCLFEMSRTIFYQTHPVKKKEKMPWGSPWGCKKGGKAIFSL